MTQELTVTGFLTSIDTGASATDLSSITVGVMRTGADPFTSPTTTARWLPVTTATTAIGVMRRTTTERIRIMKGERLRAIIAKSNVIVILIVMGINRGRVEGWEGWRGGGEDGRGEGVEG